MPWSAAGSSTRAQISSSSSRGAVAPRISVRPAATRSAARVSSARPNRAAWATSRSPWSSDTSISPVAGASGTADTMTRSRSLPEQVLGEPPRVLAGLDHLVDDPEHRGAVAGRERVDHVVEQRVGGVAEQTARQVVGHPGGARATEQLVEHGEGVARGPGAGADDERQRGGLDGHALELAELGEVRRQQPRRDQPERVVVGARPDGGDHLVRLGRGEDEPQVRRRLLDQLEQGVEALRRSPCAPRR